MSQGYPPSNYPDYGPPIDYSQYAIPSSEIPNPYIQSTQQTQQSFMRRHIVGIIFAIVVLIIIIASLSYLGYSVYQHVQATALLNAPLPNIVVPTVGSSSAPTPAAAITTTSSTSAPAGTSATSPLALAPPSTAAPTAMVTAPSSMPSFVSAGGADPATTTALPIDDIWGLKTDGTVYYRPNAPKGLAFSQNQLLGIANKRLDRTTDLSRYYVWGLGSDVLYYCPRPCKGVKWSMVNTSPYSLNQISMSNVSNDSSLNPSGPTYSYAITTGQDIILISNIAPATGTTASPSTTPATVKVITGNLSSPTIVTVGPTKVYALDKAGAAWYSTLPGNGKWLPFYNAGVASPVFQLIASSKSIEGLLLGIDVNNKLYYRSSFSGNNNTSSEFGAKWTAVTGVPAATPAAFVSVGSVDKDTGPNVSAANTPSLWVVLNNGQVYRLNASTVKTAATLAFTNWVLIDTGYAQITANEA